ncbi:amino acid ABC transporter substrate-binding protein [uncultured Methanobrevibacter sp.]|uniref:amino acid ABC transporter substrate-binding protein n=1 Tax=uncultured Methanobrevibacter sp. TaxID=253161 RepID=UPI0026176248
MNKKFGIIIGIVLLLFLVIGSASAAGFLDFLGDSDSASADDDTFVVGFDAEFPPYGYKADNGSYVGFDLDLAKEVCKRNNWTFKEQPIDWDAKDSELDSGSIDCIWNGFTINGREDDYTWTEPYIDNKQVVVVKADSGIDSLEDLEGKIVETQKDSSALAALEGDQKDLADTFQTLTQIADYNTAFMDLQSGACDAVAMDIGVAQYQISKDNPDDYKILTEEISSEQYGVGFKKGNTELRDQVQATLDEMFEDGTVEKIAANYEDFGVPGSLIQK